MNGFKSSFSSQHLRLILMLTLVLPATGDAETFQFKVVYADVPGIEEIRAGNHRAAIAILQSRVDDVGTDYIADELATLCALYTVIGKLSAASVICHDAVETDGSDAAYNNRGVFRAHLGDAAGALQDFQRARVLPADRQRYIEERMQSDARLVASRNYTVATRYTAKTRDSGGKVLASRIQGASVEEIIN